MPLDESPVPTRCACMSQTRSASSPSQAAFTSSCRAIASGKPARQGFQNPCSGQNFQAASALAPANAAPPNRRSRRFRRTEGLGRPILDIALEHLVFEILLFEHCLGDIAEGDDAKQLSFLHYGQVARAGIEHR